MLIGHGFMLAGALLFISTSKRPTWLGGNPQRYTSEDTAYAAVSRGQKRSIAMWMFMGGCFSAIVGV